MNKLKIDVFLEYEKKLKTIEALEDTLSEVELKEARKDFHAKRLPRPCGLTVHTGIGCDYACAYCYIPDMGFPFKAKPYPLKGKQLAYAIAYNPSVAVGVNGTFLAIGSVTEPFLEATSERTFEYLENIFKYLGNPVQISTKSHISLENAYRLKKISKGKLSILVTIITLKHYKLLEPKAPTPTLRFETLYNLAKVGFKPVLFLRPIMPGINDKEIEDIIVEARRYGIRRILLGSLRVTNRIISKLKVLGFDVSEIMSRMKEKPKDNKQVSVITADIKEKAVKIAIKHGVRMYFQACQVCSEDCNIPCWMPCTVKYKCTHGVKIVIDENQVKEFLRNLNFNVREVVDTPYSLIIYGKINKHIASFLRWIVKKKVVVRSP